MMLADEGKDHCGQIGFEGETRNKPLVEGRISREKHVECDFDPGGLGTLSRMVETRQLCEILLCISEPWVGYRIDKTEAFEPSQVFFGDGRQNFSDIGFCPGR